MKYFLFLITLSFLSCAVKPLNYSYKNKFNLNEYVGSSLLRTDCYYVNSRLMDTYSKGTVEVFEYVKFFSNGRVYYSKSFFDSIPVSEFSKMNSLEDIYVKEKKYDYDTGRKGYYMIDEKGVLHLERYLNARQGYAFYSVNILKDELVFFKVKIKNGGKESSDLRYKVKEVPVTEITRTSNW